jgi:hypothetical protein
MKKKIYEKPTIEIVKLQQQHIICTSPGGMESVGIPDGEISNEINVWSRELDALDLENM